MAAESSQRHLGLFGATAVGVGAIVGGGILALAGVAFATTGPSAILAFAANGAIAAITAISFARLARSFPESGGTYAYAKKVLSVEVAFTVGWVVWFASIVAAVLYALGFAAFLVEILERLGRHLEGGAPLWLGGRAFHAMLAVLAVLFYTHGLVRRSSGGGQWATVGKVVVFAVLVIGGIWVFARTSFAESTRPLQPFFSRGGFGLIQAMGYTFIALQGFDLIAAVGGEVQDPERNLPRSIYLSLGIALAIYLPLLFLVATVGMGPGDAIQRIAAGNPEGVVAIAAERFLGVAGYWLVVVAGVLSMLSALQANLFGASRVAFAMARDRTLPRALGRVRENSGTPAAAILVTAAAVMIVALLVPDVAAAGAAASLIFLVSFAMVHWTALLASRRSGNPHPPWIPILGAIACLALAVFQGLTVGSAGALASLWLGVGVALYLTTLAPGARVADASARGSDPNLVRLRGRAPLVLVPVANPQSAAGLVSIAQAVATPLVGRVLLLSTIDTTQAEAGERDGLDNAADVLRETLHASVGRRLAPETLVTFSANRWTEIARVAALHRCETLLLGLSGLEERGMERIVEDLMGRVTADVILLRAPAGWDIGSARRVLVPLGGRRDQSLLRARLLASLGRGADREVHFLQVLPEKASDADLERARRSVRSLAEEEARGVFHVDVCRAADAGAELCSRSADFDLVILGTRRAGRQAKFLGDLPLRLTRETGCPLALISRRG